MKASSEISSRRGPPAEPSQNGASSSSTAERFRLTGPSIILDETIHAYRRDLADVALAGQLFAPHYARPVLRVTGVAGSIHRAPDAASELVGSLEAGEQFAVLDVSAGWAWGYRRSDHRVGYVPEAVLAAERAA